MASGPAGFVFPLVDHLCTVHPCSFHNKLNRVSPAVGASTAPPSTSSQAPASPAPRRQKYGTKYATFAFKLGIRVPPCAIINGQFATDPNIDTQPIEMGQKDYRMYAKKGSPIELRREALGHPPRPNGLYYSKDLSFFLENLVDYGYALSRRPGIRGFDERVFAKSINEPKVCVFVLPLRMPRNETTPVPSLTKHSIFVVLLPLFGDIAPRRCRALVNVFSTLGTTLLCCTLLSPFSPTHAQ